MAELTLPFGTPPTRFGDPVMPPEEPESVDPLLHNLMGAARARSTMFEPPVGSGVRPDLIPVSFWRQIQRDDLITRGRSIGLMHDGLDLGFNAQVEAQRQHLSGLDLPSAQKMFSPPQPTTEDYLKFSADEAISEMRMGPITSPSTQPFYSPVEMKQLQDAQRPIPTREDTLISTISDIATNFAQGFGGLAAATPFQRNAWGQVGRALGEAFNPNFIRNAVARVTATALMADGTHDNWTSALADGTERMDTLWGELPRPAQLFLEELTPGNIGLALGGGYAARVVVASGVPGAGLLANLLKPLAESPVKSVALQIGANIATRGAYEATPEDFGPGITVGDTTVRPLRLGIAAGAGVAAIHSGNLLSKIKGMPAGMSINEITPEWLAKQTPELRARIEARGAEMAAARAAVGGAAPAPSAPLENAPEFERALTNRGVILGTLARRAETAGGPGSSKYNLSPALTAKLTERADEAAATIEKALQESPDEARRLIQKVHDAAVAEQDAALQRAADLLPVAGTQPQNLSVYTSEALTEARDAAQHAEAVAKMTSEILARPSAAAPAPQQRALPDATVTPEMMLNRRIDEAAELVSQLQPIMRRYEQNIAAMSDAVRSSTGRESAAIQESLLAERGVIDQEASDLLSSLNKGVRAGESPRGAVGTVLENALLAVTRYSDEAAKLHPPQQRALPDPFSGVGDILAPDPNSIRTDVGQYATQALRDAQNPENQLNARVFPFVGTPRNAHLPYQWPDALVITPDILPYDFPVQATGIVNRTLDTQTAFSATKTAIDRAALLAAQETAGISPNISRTVPTGVAHAIIEEQAHRDVVGISRVLDIFNGTFKKVKGSAAPRWQAVTSSPIVRVGVGAERRAMVLLNSRIAPSRVSFLEDIKGLFGGTENLPDNMLYIGPETRWIWGVESEGTGRAILAADHPATGTIVDAYYHPESYDWSAAGGDAGRARFFERMKQFDGRNSAVLDHANKNYGLDVGEYRPAPMDVDPRGVTNPEFFRAHIPTINRSNTVGLPDTGTGISGRAMERSYATIFDRWADPHQEFDNGGFQPSLDLNFLFTANDDAKAMAAGRSTFRYAVGGVTQRPSAASLTSPVNRSAMQPGMVEVPGLGRNPEDKVYLPADEAKHVLDYMNGEGNEFFNKLQLLKNTRLNADMSPFTMQGFLSFITSPNDTLREIVGSIGSSIENSVWNRAATTKAMALDIVQRSNDWLDFFTNTGFAPATSTPEELRSGLLESIPWLGGKVHNFNEGAMNVLLRTSEANYRETKKILLSEGFTLAEAKSGAADAARYILPITNFTDLGMSAGRVAAERGSFTSTSFIRQPVSMAAHALSGWKHMLQDVVQAPLQPKPGAILNEAGKVVNEMGIHQRWSRLTPRERVAMRITARQAASAAILSAASGAWFATSRGYTPQEAVLAAINPTHPDGWKIWLTPEFSFSVAPPLRQVIRAVSPQMVEVADGVSIPIPFWGMGTYAQGKVTPPISTLTEMATGKDFLGHNIVTSDNPAVQALQIGLFLFSEIPPTPIGAVFGSTRNALESGIVAKEQGKSAWDAMQSAGFDRGVPDALYEVGQGLAGVSGARRASGYARYENQRRVAAWQIYKTTDEQKAAMGLTPAQVAASRGARTIDELRNAIGTTSANVAAEHLIDPKYREQYIASIRQRAAGGDRQASALLSGIGIQERLAAVAQATSVNEANAGVKYREQRSSIVAEGIGASNAFREEFSKMRRASSEIDRLTSQWYDLFDKATIYKTVNGQQVSAGVDREVFSEMESAFFASIGSDKAALVESNTGTAPLGANPTEVALKADRAKIADSGYWDIDREQWKNAKPILMSDKYGATPELKQAAFESKSMAEFKTRAVTLIHPGFVKQGYDPDVAVTVATRFIEQTDEVLDYEGDRKTSREAWIRLHIEDGLADKAVKWGYLSDAYADDILELRQELEAKKKTSGGAPAAPAAPPRRSQNVESAPGQEPDALVAMLADGLSYGQIAVKTGLSRDTVIGRIRRASGTMSPASLRET